MTPTSEKEEKGQNNGQGQGDGNQAKVTEINDKQKGALEKFKQELQKQRPEVFDELFGEDENKHVTREGDKICVDMHGTKIEIGRGGGFNLPQIRSYRNGFDAALVADKLREKQEGNWRAPRGSGMSREQNIAQLKEEVKQKEQELNAAEDKLQAAQDEEVETAGRGQDKSGKGGKNNKAA